MLKISLPLRKSLPLNYFSKAGIFKRHFELIKLRMLNMAIVPPCKMIIVRCLMALRGYNDKDVLFWVLVFWSLLCTYTKKYQC